MRVLGIDPGLATMGFGIVDVEAPRQLRVRDWGAIVTSPGLPLADRLREIQEDIAAYIQEWHPDLAVVEQVFHAQNTTSSIAVAHARGVCMATLARAGIRVVEATPLRMKAAITGDGRADKRQVQEMLLHLLHLEEIPRPDDAADALALAAYGALHEHTEEYDVLSRC